LIVKSRRTLVQWFPAKRQLRLLERGVRILEEVCEEPMATKLNRNALAFAEQLIQEGKFVYDKRDDWSKHQPSTQKENEFIHQHGFAEYEKWHLGIDDAEPADTKARYKFPYGDFKDLHRCGILSAESRAGQYKHYDIESAGAHLHGILEALHKKLA
jgi:hypothetical protein